MRQQVFVVVASIGVLCVSEAHARDRSATFNPAISMQKFLFVSAEAAQHRKSRRLSELEFLRLSRERGTIVLDARSREKYAELHVAGAVNLSFPDFTFESLARVLPDKQARILIYCNNNFRNAEGPFPEKKLSAALNLSTYIALYDYGYRNVYELGPLLDPKASELTLESSKH